MNKRNLTILFFLISITTQAQILRDINYRYLYNPEEVFSLTIDVVKQQENYSVYYELQLNDTTRKLTGLTLQWETRQSLGDRAGIAIPGDEQSVQITSRKKTGTIKFSADKTQTIVMAKVSVTEGKKTYAFLFYKKLPLDNSLYASTGGIPVTNSFVSKNAPLGFTGFDPDKPLQISYYENSFPAGAPAFSTAQAKVPKVIKPDSLFYANAQSGVALQTTGLYLVQQDTASAQGVAFRVEEDYPKFGKLESLAGPLIYVCTKQEYDKIKLAGNDKKKFDQVILSITGNTERARTFMRSYFKRVELANLYFSSYKEGWKTDRGMIYIIFGLPEEVYLFEDREVWEYNNDTLKARFQFVKSPTIFDPENYVLIRDRKFTEDWYSVIDLWRKARF